MKDFNEYLKGATDGFRGGLEYLKNIETILLDKATPEEKAEYNRWLKRQKQQFKKK